MFAVKGSARHLRCYRCGIEKPVHDFAWRRKDRGQQDTFCRPCRSAYGREHYEANRQRYIDQARVQKERLRLERTKYLIDFYLIDFFETHPCIDCGERDPVVLEFDHLRDKRFSIGLKLCTNSWKSILAEMEKCEVVCANCHRKRTARRKGSLRAVLTQD